MTFLRRNAISLTALCVALGGTSYAATTLGRNTVGTAQLRAHSVTPAKLAKAAQPLTATQLRDVITGVVTDPANNLTIQVKAQQGDKGDTGSQGPQGDPGVKGDTGSQGVKGDTGNKGDTGLPGGAQVYGHVAGDGTLTSSSGMSVTHPVTGTYCVSSVVHPVNGLVATIDTVGATNLTVTVSMSVGADCAGRDGQVTVTNLDSHSVGDGAFYVMVN